MVDERKAGRREWAAARCERRERVVAGLRDVASSAIDDCDAALAWLGVAREAARFLRGLPPAGVVPEGRGATHRVWLEEAAEEAERGLAACDPTVLSRARERLGLRVALVGKGGAGKSMIAATLARLLARRGWPVLAVDLDTCPGLGFSLGVPGGAGVLGDTALESHDGAPYGFGLRRGADPVEVMMTHGAVGPDGVRFISRGKIRACDKRGPRQTSAATLEVVAGFADPSWAVIGDLEAGPTTPFERFHAFADLVLVVVTPTWASAMTARRLLPLVDDAPTLIVANGFGDEPDHPGLDPVVRIPRDPAIAEAERRGLAPLDCCPDSPAVAAVARLADRLTHRTGEAVASPGTARTGGRS